MSEPIVTVHLRQTVAVIEKRPRPRHIAARTKGKRKMQRWQREEAKRLRDHWDAMVLSVMFGARRGA